MLACLRLAVLALVFLLSSGLNASLPGGISGSWYNPEQPGHGLSVVVPRPGHAIVVWNVYDLEGAPLILVADGEIVDRSIVAPVYAPRGMKFGEFDSADLEVPVWGHIEIEFSSCVEGTLRWETQAEGFESGEMDIVRLAFIEGAPCDLNPLSQLKQSSGLFSGFTEGFGSASTIGMVDLEGRLWAIEDSVPIPSPIWVGARLPYGITAEPVLYDAENRTVQVEGHAGKIRWSMNTGQGSTSESDAAVPLDGEWQMNGDITGRFEWIDDHGGAVRNFTETLHQGAPDNTELVAPISVAMLAGAYRVPLANQFGVGFADMTIDTNGQVCIGLEAWGAPEGECQLHGTVDTPDGKAGLIDFEIESVTRLNRPPYAGRGWMMLVDGQAELVLVGDDGDFFFGLIAEPKP